MDIIIYVTLFMLIATSYCPDVSLAADEQVAPIDQYKEDPNGGLNIYFSPSFIDGLEKGTEYDEALAGLVDELNEKRSPSWTNLRVGAGKRSPAWNNLRTGTGKRTPSWNNLRIGSGKRGPSPDSTRDWNKLSGLIGKRSVGWNQINSSWGKRAVDPQWNTMSSNWGKRGWNDMNAAFGKRSPNGIAHWNNMRGMWG